MESRYFFQHFSYPDSYSNGYSTDISYRHVQFDSITSSKECKILHFYSFLIGDLLNILIGRHLNKKDQAGQELATANVPNFKCIHELLNSFEDSAKCAHTIRDKQTYVTVINQQKLLGMVHPKLEYASAV